VEGLQPSRNPPSLTVICVIRTKEGFVKKISLTLVFLIVLVACVPAQESSNIATEKWRCFGLLEYRLSLIEGSPPKGPGVVRLTRVAGDGEDHGFGEVSIAGVTHQAYFQVTGFDRRWDFGEGPKYAFIIKPDGSGLYYDFSDVEDGGKTGSSQHFNCVSP